MTAVPGQRTWRPIVGWLLTALVVTFPATRALSQPVDADDPLVALLASSLNTETTFPVITRETLVEAGETEVGILIDVQGDVERLYNFAAYDTARVGDTVLTNEIISTYDGGLAVIEFEDGTLLSLGSNSEAEVNVFDYTTATNLGSMSVNLLSGLIKFASGTMSPASYTISSPNGTAQLRGTELVFLIEPDGEMHLAVFLGAVDFTLAALEDSEPETSDPSADGATDPVAEDATETADPPSQTFTLTARNAQGEDVDLTSELLSINRDEDGDQAAASVGQMLESFTQVEAVFQDPKTYSTFVSSFKTEQFEQKIIDSCTTGLDCSEQIAELVEELGSLGVEKDDALGSLDQIEEGLRSSGATLATLRSALDTLEVVKGDVEQSYVPLTNEAVSEEATEEIPEAQTAVEILDPEVVLETTQQSNALSVDGTEAADQSDPALTGDSATEDEVIEETIDENADLEAADGDSVSPVAAAAKTIGTALTPGASFTVFSNPSSLQDFEQLTLQSQVIPSANSSNTSFGITFNFAYPYYASVYGLTSQSFIGTGTDDWIGLAANSPVMAANVDLRANGGFRMLVNFPALETARGGCGPVVVSSIDDTTNVYVVPGQLTVSLDGQAAFELDDTGAINEATNIQPQFEVVEFICDARDDGLYSGVITLEIFEHKAHDLNVALDILTAQTGPRCEGPVSDQSFLCSYPNLNFQLRPIALQLSTATEQ